MKLNLLELVKITTKIRISHKLKSFLLKTDAEMPVISGVPSNIAQDANANSNTAAVSWTPPTASDNSGSVASLTSTHNPGDMFDIGTTTVMYTATDPYSNEAVASFTVTVTGKFNLRFKFR